MPSSLFARSLSFWLLLATGVVLLDQLSKLWVVQHFLLGESQPVTGFFNLVRAHNPGAAFSFLAGAGGWQRWFFVALALAAAGVIVWMLKRHPGHWVFNLALAMILGGAVGNVIDRIAYGHVVDFLQFHWELLTPLFPGGYFPAFNLADSAITFGAFCLIADELRHMRHGDTPPPSAP